MTPEQPAAPRCATCVFWDRGARRGSEARICARPLAFGDSEPERERRGAIADQPGPGFVHLLTGPEFGCVLHEAARR